MAMGVVAGLTLFLLGIERLAAGFGALAAERVRGWVAKFTTSPVAGVGTGAVACTILDSSSVTIVMVIAMIEGGVMTFAQALGVVMGANIGTTVGSQIIAFQVHDYAPVAMLMGLVLELGGRSEKQRQVGGVVLGFGLLFFGLGHLGETVRPIGQDPSWMAWLASLGEVPVKGALAGCLFTLTIQSSSATVGMAIVLASEGLIPLPAGVAIMLGAEIGTTATAILATIGRSRAAVRTAVFHLFFNTITVALGLLFVAELAGFAQWLTPGGSTARHVANAHVVFNVLGVLLFLPLVGRAAQALYLMIPAGEMEVRPTTVHAA